MTTFGVLGPLVATRPDGTDVTPPGDLQRRLLAMLLLRRGHVVSVDRLVEAMWPSDSPPGPAALHSHVSRLRKRIDDLGLEFTGGGYRLEVPADDLDAVRFESAVSAALADAGDRPATALEALDEALGWWRGRPYADLADDEDGFIEIARLEEIRTRAVEERLAALVAVGRGADAVADLEALVAREPLRERPRRVLMDALSASGRRAEALRVYDAYRLVLADELGVAPSPEIRSRHDELLALDDAVAPPSASGSERVQAVPPRPISALFGREDELEIVADRVATSRLVTLIGPGGVGKTRLAVEVAHRLAAEFADGITFCDLTRIGDGAGAEEVAAAIGAVLRIEQRVGVPAAERVAEVCRSDELLIVLDNCEHVLDGAAEVVETLLGTTGRLRVLATSRERLAVDGEVLSPVSPLPCEQEDGLAAARALFLDRAAATGVSTLPDEAVGELCRRLDGLPLAIELAAARLRSLTLDEIVAGLEESRSVLSGGRRTVTRHRSLDAAIDWSYRQLSDELRDVLVAAAAFAAPIDALDVAAVLAVPESTSRERLAALVDRSLVFRSDGRFRLLETIRSFVREQSGGDRRTSLAVAHARHVVDRVEAASALLRHADDDAPIVLTRHLVPDVLQALTTALDHRDADLAARLVVASRDLALDAMLPELMTCAEQAGELAAALDHPLGADLFGIAALGRWKTGDLTSMRRLLERAVAETARLGLPERYEVLGALGLEALAHGDLERAVEHGLGALAAPEVGDDLHRLAEGWATAAIYCSYAHDATALDLVDRLLAEVEPEAGAAPRAWCWYAAGECLLDQDQDLARVRLERSVADARLAGATFVEGIAATSLASLCVRQGRVDEAVELYRWLLPHWLRAGVAAPFWTMLRSVTELLVDRGADERHGDLDVDEHAARLLGAVTHAGRGHEVVGDDDLRLSDAAATLRSRLGDERFETAVSAGGALDEPAAAAIATAAFDRIS